MWAFPLFPVADQKGYGVILVSRQAPAGACRSQKRKQEQFLEFSMIFHGIFLKHVWVVYKQFPGFQGELQGGVLDSFEVIFG